MTTPSIMAYVGGAHVVGVNNDAVLPDWVNNRLFFVKDGTIASSGVRQFNGYSTGVENTSANLTDLGIPGIATSGAIALSSGGFLIVPQSASNSVVLSLINSVTLATAGSFGVSSGSLAASTTTRILLPHSIGTFTKAGQDYFVFCALIGNPGEVCVMTSPGMVNANLGTMTEALGVVSSYGPAGKTYALGKRTAGGYAVPNTDPIGLYSVTPSALTRIGSVTPAQVDATWTKFNYAQGIAYDQTDGNVIVMVGTNEAVAQQQYFVKLNVNTAAVIWKCAVNTTDANGDVNISRHRIVNQTLYYMGAAHTFYTINTNTGVATSVVLDSYTVSGGQLSEDVNNSLIVYGTWTQNTTVPNYIGNYMGTLGNHALTNQWGRWFPVGPTPPFPSSAPVSTALNPTLSTNIAWTYTLDGHVFYVLDLGAEGTFLYDTTTGEWANFITQGYTNWNFTNGTQWNQRVVGGDLASTDVWELVPSALKDNGAQALDITHVCTGGLTLRSRIYRSCDAVRLAMSWGEYQDLTAATISLSFSDDFGETFSAPITLALTENDFSSEITWTSLGSFAAPGRIFQITDVGGPLRIDGCDAAIDGFDTTDGDPRGADQ